MKVKRIIIGILIGATAGAGLEYVNACLTFLAPPLRVLLPAAVLIGVCIGLLVDMVRDSRSLAKSEDAKRLPVSAAEFVKLVVEKMRYRKKVCADVMAELTAHFEDGLRNCKTDEAKQERTKQLIAEFGDVKLLGTLLRRAKKRCRPLWRTVAARAFQTVGVLILCLIVYVVWFLTGKPQITVDYVAQLNRMVRPVADENLNAAPLYDKAAQLYGKPSDDFLLFFAENYDAIIDQTFPHRGKLIAVQIRKLFSENNKTDSSKERQQIQEEVVRRLSPVLSKRYDEAATAERKFIERWVEDSSEALDLVLAATQKPYYWQEYGQAAPNTGMMGILMPHLSESRGFALSLCWRARLRAEQGRYEEALRDIKSCYRLGQHLRGQTLIEHLVRIAVEVRAAQGLCDILGEQKIGSKQMAVLQKDFEQMIAGEDFVPSFEAEKLSAYDVIQRCFTEGRFGGGHVCLEGLRLIEQYMRDNLFERILEKENWTAPLHVLFTHPNKQESKETVDRLYAFWDKAARKTPARIRAENIDLDEQMMEIIEGNILLEILMPALGRVSELSYRRKAEVDAAVTILALLRYGKDKGHYPEALQELTAAGYLKKLPIDPYSDQPLVYDKTDDGFTLYSVGENFTDDGGTRTGPSRSWGEDGRSDRVFWPVETHQQWKKRLEKEREKDWRMRREGLRIR